MIDWCVESPKIAAEAGAFAVDPLFIEAIRHSENGRPGREFGVLLDGVDTYEAQLHVTCRTVAHRVAAYGVNPMVRCASGRLRYSPNFIAYFAHVWAPSGANNDPKHLNENWYKNAVEFYLSRLPA